MTATFTGQVKMTGAGAALISMTGAQIWKEGGKGSLTYADQMLYCLDERGIMMLVKANT